MSKSLTDYPLLGLENITNLQEEWNIYTRIEQRDIANGEALVEWWEGHPELEFREAVLFLILTAISSGAVQFFSMTSTVTAA